MRAAIEALGYSPNQLEVEIIQLVHLFEDGVQVKMSKRTGKSVTMRDLIEEVGLMRRDISLQCVVQIHI